MGAVWIYLKFFEENPISHVGAPLIGAILLTSIGGCCVIFSSSRLLSFLSGIFLAVFFLLATSACVSRSHNESQEQEGGEVQNSYAQTAQKIAEFKRFAYQSQGIICGLYGSSFSDIFAGEWYNLQNLIGTVSASAGAKAEYGLGVKPGVAGAVASFAMKTPCQISQTYSAALEYIESCANAAYATQLAAQVAAEMCARMRRIPEYELQRRGFQPPVGCRSGGIRY